MAFSKLSVVPLPDTCAFVTMPPKCLKQRYSKFSPLRFLDSQSYTNHTPVHLRSRLVHAKTFELMPPKRLTQLQNLALPLTNSQSYPNHTLVHLRSRLSYTRKHSILCFQNVSHNSKFSLLHSLIPNRTKTIL